MTSKSDPQTIGGKDNTTPAQDDIVKIAAMRNPVPKAEKPRFELPWPPRRENGATYLLQKVACDGSHLVAGKSLLD